MEGVVLYVTLVRVFIKNHVGYVIGFTVASYGSFGNACTCNIILNRILLIGIPALYMALVVPIGYSVNVVESHGNTHYLYFHETDLIA